MSLRTAAAIAMFGMALWVILLAANFLYSLIALSHGAVAAAATLTALIHFLAALSLLIFFAVFHRSQS
jgi:tryptophan-rich sensory protein